MAGGDAQHYEEAPAPATETEAEREERLKQVEPHRWAAKQWREYLSWADFRARQKERPWWKRAPIAVGAWSLWPFLAAFVACFVVGYAVLYAVLWVLLAPIRIFSKKRS